jgi:mediator of RNA polymerase II transcription subunit 16
LVAALTGGRKISWSKSGCVAYISPDNYSVNLRAFSRDAETGKWNLGKDVPLELPHGRDVFQLSHLSWSHLGNDLAVIDEAGRVMIFSCIMALDRMHFERTEIAHPESEVDAVVGMHWLAILPYGQKVGPVPSLEEGYTDIRQTQIAWSASRNENKWNWNIQHHAFKDAHHPVEGKASLIYLKKYGELKLRFQQNDSTWQETSVQLGPMVSTRESFTHAAFASNNGKSRSESRYPSTDMEADNTLLLAAYDVQRRLHLYRVETVWNVPADKRSQNAGPFEKPTLQVKLIKTEDDCNPVQVAHDDLSNGGTTTRGAAAAQLTYLDFLPLAPDQDDGSIPTIQAIFCRPPNAVSYDMHPQETRHSVVVKWEVHQQQQNQLHPSIDQVTSKKKSVSSVPGQSVLSLKRKPDFTLHAVVLAFHPIWYNMLLAFCYSDGVIEFRKRTTMEIVMPDVNTNTVTSLMQAGYVFQHGEPSLHVAFSPNHCIAVCMQLDGTSKLRSMEYQHGTLSTDDEDPRHSAALAALSLQSSSAANQYYCSDDIFAILGPLSPKRIHSFTNLLFDALKVNIDCGIDDSSNNHFLILGRSPVFVKVLSAMHLLGSNGPINRSLTSKMAWQVLNIKYVTQILTTIARMHGDLTKTTVQPGYIPFFIGVSRWIMHYMAYILDELFSLGRALADIPSQELTREVLEAKIAELNKPAVLLLLSAFPRAMMKLWAQPINWIKRCTEAFLATSNNLPAQAPEVKRVYTPLHAAVTELPFDYRYFEQLLGETQNLVRGTYKSKNISDHERNLIERDLLLGKVPEVLFPVAKRLVTDFLWNSKPQNVCLADKIDTGKLMFFDTTWLGFSESERAAIWHDQHVVDVSQKIIIRGLGAQNPPVTTSQLGKRTRRGSIQSADGEAGGERSKKNKMRQCVRCGECMEDVVPGLPGYTPQHRSWLLGVTKHCVCGNSWMLTEEKKKAR